MTSVAYVFILVSLCVVGAAYQTQTGWLYILGAFGLGIVPLAWATARWDLAGVRLRTTAIAPAVQGSPLELTVAVERLAPGAALGLQVLLPDVLPGRLQRWWRGHLVPSGWRNRAVAPLGRGDRAKVTFELVTRKRGEFQLPTLLLQSAFPLGLVAIAHRHPLEGTFLVYPTGPRLREVPWLAARGHEQGQRLRFEAGPGAAPRGVRDYRPGDPWRQIHWRTTARLGAPHVKETEREQGEALVLYLDMRAERHTPESVEHLVSVATSLLHHMRGQAQAVELRTQPEAEPPGEGRQDEASQLAWLARLQPVRGAAPPQGVEGAVLLSPDHVAGWQTWAAALVYCPSAPGATLDATAYCPVGAEIDSCLCREACA